MQNALIFTNEKKDLDFSKTREIIQHLQYYGIEAKMTDAPDITGASDFIISIGGDGTFLKAAREALRADIPIIGINLGTLGFLTEGEMHESDRILSRLASGQFSIENRMMLEAGVHINGRQQTALAVNDVVITRLSLSRILHLKVYVNDLYVEDYPGDGIIIASPTGSTAYSLSAGGPIVEPASELMIINPICPHILHSRSLIISAESVVRIVVDSRYQHQTIFTLDGQLGFEAQAGDWIEVKRAPCRLKVIKTGGVDFFELLRKKISERREDPPG